MRSLSKASLKIAFGSIGSWTPSQSTWDVSCACAIEPSLAVKLIVVVKVALPFVSFWLSLPHSVKCPLQSTPASLKLTVPVSVKVAQNSGSPGKKVTCSTRFPSTCQTTGSFVHGLNPSGSSNKPCTCVERLTVCPGSVAPVDGAITSRQTAPAINAATRIALISFPLWFGNRNATPALERRQRRRAAIWDSSYEKRAPISRERSYPFP